jgi:hypothetical protein
MSSLKRKSSFSLSFLVSRLWTQNHERMASSLKTVRVLSPFQQRKRPSIPFFEEYTEYKEKNVQKFFSSKNFVSRFVFFDQKNTVGRKKEFSFFEKQ